MNDKYVIKNCPAWQPHEVYYCYNSGNTRICPVYKDCILKQIVELAKGHTELCKNCEQQIKECDCNDICNAYRLNKILQLLDIQEVK